MTDHEKTLHMLALEGQLAQCENDKYALRRQLAEMKQELRKARAKTKRQKK